jgi:hypothetical protein
MMMRPRFIAKWVAGVAILICSSRRRRGKWGFIKLLDLPIRFLTGYCNGKYQK